jgi:DNA repair exonuclease SbcCD ATPase subunit
LLMDAKPPEEDIATLTENKGKASSIKSTALAQRLKMEKLGDKCPTCESTIDRSRVVTIINSQAQLEKAAADKLKELDVRITEARNAQLEYASKLRHEKEHKMYSELVDPSLPTELIDIYDLEDNFNKLTKQIKDAENAINLIRAANSKVDQHNEKIKLITQQTDDHLEELGVKAATMRALEVRVSHLDVLKRAFGTMGLVAFKIESMVKDLESLINQYLVDMSDGRFNIAFIVTESKLNVDLLDSGVPISISALSSGELARVNIATLLAIRKLMNSLNNNKLNLLFLDEVTTVLDDEGKERLVEVLSKETDINAFIVSHGWQHPLVDKVEVIKENDISRIEW